MKEKLTTHIKELEQIDRNRQKWSILGASVVVTILFILFDWNHLEKHQLLWLAVSFGLVISVAWWYWTMRMIRTLLANKYNEIEVLSDL
jgi:protein-S-isoprenylcysteine O-methyltransferase Ste14